MIYIFGILALGLLLSRKILRKQRKGPRQSNYFTNKYQDHWKNR